MCKASGLPNMAQQPMSKTSRQNPRFSRGGANRTSPGGTCTSFAGQLIQQVVSQGMAYGREASSAKEWIRTACRERAGFACGCIPALPFASFGGCSFITNGLSVILALVWLAQQLGLSSVSLPASHSPAKRERHLLHSSSTQPREQGCPPLPARAHALVVWSVANSAG